MINDRRPRQFLIFRIASRLFAVDVEEVAEIVSPGREVVAEPSVIPAVTTLTIGDKSYRSFYPVEYIFNQSIPVPKEFRLILLESVGEPKALIVDSVESIIRVSESEIRNSGARDDVLFSEFSGGTILQEENPIYILEPAKLFSVARIK